MFSRRRTLCALCVCASCSVVREVGRNEDFKERRIFEDAKKHTAGVKFDEHKRALTLSTLVALQITRMTKTLLAHTSHSYGFSRV